MKLKSCYKYILHMIFISGIALLSISFISINSEDKPSRIIIRTIEKEYVPDSKEHIGNGGIRASTPVTDGKVGVQLLPIPDANSLIIFSPLL